MKYWKHWSANFQRVIQKKCATRSRPRPLDTRPKGTAMKNAGLFISVADVPPVCLHEPRNDDIRDVARCISRMEGKMTITNWVGEIQIGDVVTKLRNAEEELMLVVSEEEAIGEVVSDLRGVIEVLQQIRLRISSL
jgi:hypothetical protein